jgi:hypothetical protein
MGAHAAPRFLPKICPLLSKGMGRLSTVTVGGLDEVCSISDVLKTDAVLLTLGPASVPGLRVERERRRHSGPWPAIGHDPLRVAK